MAKSSDWVFEKHFTSGKLSCKYYVIYYETIIHVIMCNIRWQCNVIYL